MLNLLEKKEIIQSYICNSYLSKIDKQDPYAISKFEKEIKRLSYSIKDEILKKYVLEDFLEKLRNLTPLQFSRQKFKNTKSIQQKNIKVLNETKILHQKKKDLSKIQIIEFSILFVLMNYFEIAEKKIEQISELEFLSKKNEDMKNTIIKMLSAGEDKNKLEFKNNNEFKNLIEEIKENSNIQLITQNKNEQEILELLNDLIEDFNEQNNLKRIESLEKKLINNLDENSYSELIRLKSQLNRE